jgi:hypothetical protein
MSSARLYSVVEARALLPQVIPVLESIRATFVELRAVNATISAEQRGATGDGALLADPWSHDGGRNRAEALVKELRDAFGRLDAWGIELKDPERGLIDFRHQRESEVVYLCYLLGESDIGYWHTQSAGFAGRQRL